MEQSVYKIGEVSARLGLADKNNNTLRSWVEEFGEFLSALANPATGQPRRFTSRDVQVLTAIRDYRANHLSFEEIRERLRAGEHDVTPPQPREMPFTGNDAGTQASGQGGQALVPVAQLEALLAPLAASADEWRRLAEEYRHRLEGREARIETLERRVEELYARLDTALQDAVPAPLARPDLSPPEMHADPEAVATAGSAIDDALSGAPASVVSAANANGNGSAPRPASQGDTRTAIAEDNKDESVAGGNKVEARDAPREREAETPLFPLPVVDHHAGADTASGSAVVDRGSGVPRVESAPRRRWWRPWA